MCRCTLLKGAQDPMCRIFPSFTKHPYSVSNERKSKTGHSIILNNPTLIPDASPAICICGSRFSYSFHPFIIFFFYSSCQSLSCETHCALVSYRISCSFTTSLTTTTSSGDREASSQASSGMSARLKVRRLPWSRHSW